MRKKTPIGEEQKLALGIELKRTKNKEDFRRLQCVWMRATLGLDTDLISIAVGYSPSTVKIVQSRYLRGGISALLGKGRGGRRRENLTKEEETKLLQSFHGVAQQGGILVVSDLKKVYEETIGRTVPKSTVYRMLARHGWRKVVPRPRHLKSDTGNQEEFKKNSRSLSEKKNKSKP